METDMRQKPLWLQSFILGGAVLLSPTYANETTLAQLHEQYKKDFVNLQENPLIKKGHYVARAADCMGCHGEDYAGGTLFPTPMGEIVATNITPSKEYGIGNYTLEDFKLAVREGLTPNHRLYPAMPYLSYHKMSDTDVENLFYYFQSITPVDKHPKAQTTLDFPFSMRVMMNGFNLVNPPVDIEDSSWNEAQKRGAYLVNHLGHCADCHTPRDATMGYKKGKHLAGNDMGHFYAPNITPDKKTGIGNWSQEDIVAFLKYGELDQRAYAGGEMGKAVTHGLQYLTDEDLYAMAAYLQSIPAVENGYKAVALETNALPEKYSEAITFDLMAQIDAMNERLNATEAGSGQETYLMHCASCHGVDGYGQPEAFYPALVGLSILRSDNTQPLIAAIGHGMEPALSTQPKMPAFAKRLSHEQIADLVNFLRTQLGGASQSAVDAKAVQRALNHQVSAPFLVRNALLLMIIGLLAVVGLIIGLVVYFKKRNSQAA